MKLTYASPPPLKWFEPVPVQRSVEAQNSHDFYDHRKRVLGSITRALESERRAKGRKR